MALLHQQVLLLLPLLPQESALPVQDLAGVMI